MIHNHIPLWYLWFSALNPYEIPPWYDINYNYFTTSIIIMNYYLTSMPMLYHYLFLQSTDFLSIQTSHIKLKSTKFVYFLNSELLIFTYKKNKIMKREILGFSHIIYGFLWWLDREYREIICKERAYYTYFYIIRYIAMTPAAI